MWGMAITPQGGMSSRASIIADVGAATDQTPGSRRILPRHSLEFSIGLCARWRACVRGRGGAGGHAGDLLEAVLLDLADARLLGRELCEQLGAEVAHVVLPRVRPWA